MTEKQETPRHLVVQSDSRSLAERSAASLIARGTELAVKLHKDVHTRDKAGRTPLHHAARDGDVERAVFLIRNGAQVDAKSALGWTPLHIAVQFGNLEVVKLLLEHGANVNDASILVNCGTLELNGKRIVIIKSIPDDIQEDMAQSNWFPFPDDGISGGSLPIHLATSREVAAVLIEFGADVRARDLLGETPLHKISVADVAQLLIKHGADVNACCAKNMTPLHKRALEGRTEVVAVLLDNGAEVDVFDWCACSPLAYATGHHRNEGSYSDSDHIATANLLKAHGAWIERRLI